MFKNRKAVNELPRIQISPPPKKKFANMYELIKDAEKYDSQGEEDISNSTLKTLINYIERQVNYKKLDK